MNGNSYWRDALSDGTFRIELTQNETAYTAVRWIRVAPKETIEDRRLVFWHGQECVQACEQLDAAVSLNNNQPMEATDA